MKIGRNDPCPCGSGKKYKKCCLAKDEAAVARPAVQPVRTPALDLPPLPEPVLLPPPDPHEVARSALWEAFEAAEASELPALFQRALAEPEVLDAELAFEIFSTMQDSRDRTGYAAMLADLREQRDDLYQHDRHYYLDWQIADALIAGDAAALPALGAELATLAGKELDTFYTALERLSYHGQLALTAEMMRLAWPYVQRSTSLVPWAADEFARQAQDLTLLSAIEQTPDLLADDPLLVAALEAFAPIDHERLATYIALLAGREAPTWTLSDFAFQSRRPRNQRGADGDPNDSARVTLDDLTLVFLGDLYRTAGVSMAKGDLARKAFASYILKRHDGDLEPVDAPFERAFQPKGRKHKTASVVRHHPAHPLSPDRTTLDRFLGELLYFINPHYYEAAATLELIPAWLRFLQAHELLTGAQHAATLQELRDFVAYAVPIWERGIADPIVGLHVQEAWDGGVGAHSGGPEV